jgi:hypothetical protein
MTTQEPEPDRRALLKQGVIDADAEPHATQRARGVGEPVILVPDDFDPAARLIEDRQRQDSSLWSELHAIADLPCGADA